MIMVRMAAAHRKRGPRGQSFVQHVSCNTETYQVSFFSLLLLFNEDSLQQCCRSVPRNKRDAAPLHPPSRHRCHRFDHRSQKRSRPQGARDIRPTRLLATHGHDCTHVPLVASPASVSACWRSRLLWCGAPAYHSMLGFLLWTVQNHYRALGCSAHLEERERLRCKG